MADREDHCYLDPECEHPRHDPSSHPCGKRLAEGASTAVVRPSVSAEGVTAPATVPADQAAPSRPAPSPPLVVDVFPTDDPKTFLFDVDESPTDSYPCFVTFDEEA